MEWFLKADTGRDGKPRVRIFVKQRNGFVGLSHEAIQQVKPHLWTRFNDRLDEFGLEEAQAIAIEKGEFWLPKDARRAPEPTVGKAKAKTKTKAKKSKTKKGIAKVKAKMKASQKQREKENE